MGVYIFYSSLHGKPRKGGEDFRWNVDAKIMKSFSPLFSSLLSFNIEKK